MQSDRGHLDGFMFVFHYSWEFLKKNSFLERILSLEKDSRFSSVQIFWLGGLGTRSPGSLPLDSLYLSVVDKI